MTNTNTQHEQLWEQLYNADGIHGCQYVDGLVVYDDKNIPTFYEDFDIWSRVIEIDFDSYDFEWNGLRKKLYVEFWTGGGEFSLVEKLGL